MRDNGLVTVCEEAGCPNIGECWSKRHATFMIMGDTCTRACAFCNVRTGLPDALDPDEPENVARAVEQLKLNHVVITSVDRDDLADGGAAHFAQRSPVTGTHASNDHRSADTRLPAQGRRARNLVVAAKPDVFNHNLETVPGLYLGVRPGRAISIHCACCSKAKELDPSLFTKSGMMVGLGERREEVLQVMDDMRAASVDFLTIGQYLQPSRKHHPIDRFVTPEEFKSYETIAYSKGFLLVSSSPLTRSSHHAGDDFQRLRAARRQSSALGSSTDDLAHEGLARSVKRSCQVRTRLP